MFIAMNRFKVALGAEADFEGTGRRATAICQACGSTAFHLRGPAHEDHVLYSSHTIWHSREDFGAGHDRMHSAVHHSDAGSNQGLYLGHPEFEGFDVIQAIEPGEDNPGRPCALTARPYRCGAGSGIGREAAIGFAQRGSSVVLADVSGDSINTVANEIAAFGGTASAIVADLTKSADIDAMVAACAMEKFGRLDMLRTQQTHSACRPRCGRTAWHVPADIDQTVWDYTIQVGLTAVMQATRAALPIMQRQGGGAIVASISGLFAGAASPRTT